MAYPLTSETGNLATGGSVSSGDLYYLFGTALRMGPELATLNLEANEIDITGNAGSTITMMEMATGLLSGTIDFGGIWPRAAGAATGITSSVAYGSGGYVQYLDSWNIDITWPEVEITSQGGTARQYRKYMPGGIGTWGGSYTCKADNATPPVAPGIAASTTGTFKMGEGGTDDPTLSGSILTPRLVQRIKIGDVSVLTYTFKGTGELTQKAGTSLPGLLYTGTTATAITKPTWDIDSNGVADNTVVLTAATGRTFTGPAFWTKLSLAWKMDDVVRVTGTLRFAGDVTIA
jgi:hypothetical protein